MRRGRILSCCLRAACALAIALAVGGSASAARMRPTDVCIAVDPLVALGCDDRPVTPQPVVAGPAAPQPTASPPTDQPTRAVQSGTQPLADIGPVRGTSTVPRYDPRRLTLTFKRGTSQRTIASVLAQAGVTLERAIPEIRAYLVGVAPDRRGAALASLRSSPAVAGAEQEILSSALLVTPDDLYWPQQWGLRVARFPEAWDRSRGSSRVVVAVLDTGVDPKQQDLHGALVPGYDFVNSDGDPSDDDGHGTAVAGIIAARSDNREGMAGICWRCSIMPVKVLDAQGSGDDTTIAAGIVWAVDHGASVINLSLGGPGSTPELNDAVAYAVGRGAVVAAAAGNSGSTIPFYPAASPGAISVAATTEADRRYSWSNFGSWIRVAAPGCNVAPMLGGGYGNFCGTSSATPVVAGLAALVRSADPNATPAEIESALERASVPVPNLAQYGRIDASRTLTLAGPPSQPAAGPTRSTGVFSGTAGPDPATFVRVVGAGPLTATLTFKRARTLTLSLLPEQGNRPIARVAGRSPLRLERVLPAGRFRFVVAGKTKTSFVLTLSSAVVLR